MGPSSWRGICSSLCVSAIISAPARARHAAGSAPERRIVLVNGRAVLFTVAGSGDPVVFIHGLCGSTQWWKPTMALAQRHRVFMVDLPGFGANRRLGRQFVLATAPDWIRAWMDAVGIDQPAIVGHSMGAHIALRLGIAHPARVARLVLIAPAGIVPVRSAFRHWRRFLRAARLAPWRFIVELARDVMRTKPSALASAAGALRRQDLRGDLFAVSMPTLVICGAHDPLVSLAVGRLLARSIPSARLLVLRRASHVPMFEDPACLNEALTTFLADDAVAAPAA